MLLVLPIASLVTYAMVLSGAGFQAFRWTKTVENGTDYSAMNTARQMLWLPTARAREVRRQAGGRHLRRARRRRPGRRAWSMPARRGCRMDRQAFAGALLVVIAPWIGVAWLLVSEYRRRHAAQG